jgi:hypothetical protein
VSDDALWAEFHEAGFTDIWYAHPGPHPFAHRFGTPRAIGPRWHAGIWTGPHEDMICVKRCDTVEEANRCASPAGGSPEEATRLALAKLKEMGGGS